MMIRIRSFVGAPQKESFRSSLNKLFIIFFVRLPTGFKPLCVDRYRLRNAHGANWGKRKI